MRIPPLPPLVNTPEEAAAAGRPSGGGGGSDASVSVGLRPGGDGGKAGGGWGTSNIARPSAMAGTLPAGGVVLLRSASPPAI